MLYNLIVKLTKSRSQVDKKKSKEIVKSLTATEKSVILINHAINQVCRFYLNLYNL